MGTIGRDWSIGSGVRVWSEDLEVTLDLATRAVLAYGCLFVALCRYVQ